MGNEQQRAAGALQNGGAPANKPDKNAPENPFIKSQKKMSESSTQPGINAQSKKSDSRVDNTTSKSTSKQAEESKATGHRRVMSSSVLVSSSSDLSKANPLFNESPPQQKNENKSPENKVIGSILKTSTPNKSEMRDNFINFSRGSKAKRIGDLILFDRDGQNKANIPTSTFGSRLKLNKVPENPIKAVPIKPDPTVIIHDVGCLIKKPEEKSVVPVVSKGHHKRGAKSISDHVFSTNSHSIFEPSFSDTRSTLRTSNNQSIIQNENSKKVEIIDTLDPEFDEVDPDACEEVDMDKLMEEYEYILKTGDLQKNGITCIPDQEEPFSVWHGSVMVSNGLYQGGVFRFRINIPTNYPKSKPTVLFARGLFHPLIRQETGELDISRVIMSDQPLLKMLKYVREIFTKVSDEELSSYNQAAGKLYL